MAALSFAPAAAAPPTRTITQPDWLQKPTGESMAEHYPVAAQALELEGSATIGCEVTAEGSLVRCKVLDEAPKDLGFGQASLAMANDFRMKPQSFNGQPVGGGYVRIPIMFRLPKGEDVAGQAPALPPPPRTPEDLQQARALTDVMRLVDGVMRRYADEAQKIETAPEGSASGAARAGAAGALREAAEKHRGDIRDAYARALAAVFSHDEMAAITAFQAAYGQVIRDPELQAIDIKLQAGSLGVLRDAAHAAFCAKRDCGSAQALQRVWRPADPRDNRIDNPQWAAAPDAETVVAAEPELMALLGVPGAVRMTCSVATAGALDSCSVDEEAPGGLGFGRAALTLSDAYRLGRIQLDAGGLGRRVIVRAGFPAPELPPPFKGPVASSPRTLALARQLVTGLGTGDTAKLQVELQVASFESKRPPGADKRIYDDAIDAYRVGMNAVMARYAEDLANAWAGRVPEDQLAAMVAFYDSPAGKAQRQRSDALDVAAKQTVTAVTEKIEADARTTYCATHDCIQAPTSQPAKAARPEPSTRTP
ncbi:MAG TPA: TonB family protein [Phenylobacterium sp.]|nr:TonB family protein [Phenylobacterium sp.]